MNKSLIISCGLALAVFGCYGSPSVGSSPVQSQVQTLPITATTTINSSRIQLEVATTPEQQATGLMFRTSLEPDRGMLFVFQPPRPTSFWMKNTLIALDMIFLYQDEVVAVIADVPPCQSDPCPTYGPGNTLVDSVLELPAGRASELGIQVGDRLEIEFLAPKGIQE
jgi:uncharacterized membrane protein (UPF0127 family)